MAVMKGNFVNKVALKCLEMKSYQMQLRKESGGRGVGQGVCYGGMLNVALQLGTHVTTVNPNVHGIS